MKNIFSCFITSILGDVAIAVSDECRLDVSITTVRNNENSGPVEYNPLTIGIYTISVFFSNKEITSSPYQVQIEDNVKCRGIKNRKRRKQPCPYCHDLKFQSRLSRHSEKVYSDQEEVKHALKLDKLSRVKAFDKLKKPGIYKYHKMRIKSGQNYLEQERVNIIIFFSKKISLQDCCHISTLPLYFPLLMYNFQWTLPCIYNISSWAYLQSSYELLWHQGSHWTLSISPPFIYLAFCWVYQTISDLL